jgi:hypothetical protein
VELAQLRLVQFRDQVPGPGLSHPDHLAFVPLTCGIAATGAEVTEVRQSAADLKVNK